MQHPYPNFCAALRSLGNNNAERAAVLGVSERSIAYYLDGEKLPRVEVVKRVPVIDEALTLDLRPAHLQQASAAV